MAYHAAKAPLRVDRRIESLRRTLPVETYLFLLHQGATTGFVPKIDAKGRPIPEEEDHAPDLLRPKDRVELLQYLTDKAMPNVRLDAEPEAPAVSAPEDLAHLTTAELIKVHSAQGPTQDAAPIPVADQLPLTPLQAAVA